MGSFRDSSNGVQDPSTGGEYEGGLLDITPVSEPTFFCFYDCLTPTAVQSNPPTLYSPTGTPLLRGNDQDGGRA